MLWVIGVYKFLSSSVRKSVFSKSMWFFTAFFFLGRTVLDILCMWSAHMVQHKLVMVKKRRTVVMRCLFYNKRWWESVAV